MNRVDLRLQAFLRETIRSGEAAINAYELGAKFVIGNVNKTEDALVRERARVAEARQLLAVLPHGPRDAA